ncbi:MAG: hypothetical protein IK149_08125 [Oscillospiraceae bacterium]|nr:hypothetical protein [Oscillospiraceae bacterium]
MKKKKTSAALIMLTVLVGLGMLAVFFGRVIWLSGGKSFGSLYGFDLDSEENIYIGTENRICVIRSGEIVRTIPAPTSRAYAFYIQDDRLIIGDVSDGKGGVYDLDGNELSYGDYSYSQVEKLAKGNPISVNGHEYRLKNSVFSGPCSVTRDGELVFQAESSFFDGLSYWVSLSALTLTFVTLVFCVMSKKTEE